MAEIQKAFHIFLKQFFVIYKNWEPLDLDNSIEPFIDSRDPLSEKRLQWHQKAVISVMEAGGLNWLVGKVLTNMVSLSLLLLLDTDMFGGRVGNFLI
ncbi:unnamed protein product [Lactuca saligna]|uniref:Uncharacterized protein n=1 Tax=Lactuca saligna TaxID=75948 RepID=A0AA35ZLW3_LACSI|nr:unnamed protein product [Lactuca saligna]